MILHRSLQLSTFLLVISTLTEGKLMCPPLPSGDGTVVSCEVSRDNSTKIPCQGPLPGVPQRTIAKYHCVGNDTYTENVLVCRCKGKWKGLEAFESFKNSCIENNDQRNFSLSGPSELTFNSDVMERLASIAAQKKEPGYAEDALAYHNYYRGLHGSNMLKLNSSLMGAAQRWADKEIAENKTDNEPWSNRTYISNTFWLTGPSNFDYRKAVKLAVGRWYEDGEDYDYEVPVANAFSAMIWNATTDLGVGVASRGNELIVVCDYWPSGNVYVVNSKLSNNSETNLFDALALFKINVRPPMSTSDKGRISLLVTNNNSSLH